MHKVDIDRAVEQLAEARLARRPLDALDETCRPESIAEGHAVQDALVARLGEPVVGWKVAGLKPGEVMRGAVLKSRLYESPARIAAGDMPLLGVESEIAFRFDRALPPRDPEYSYDEVADAVTALPAIEVVDTRFESYKGTPLLHRLGDCMSNGALICGAARADWRAFDLSQLEVRLVVDKEVVAEGVGGHTDVDPLLPAVSLANELRSDRGIERGQIVTTGTYTGLRFMQPGQRVITEFSGFGTVEVQFAA